MGFLKNNFVVILIGIFTILTLIGIVLAANKQSNTNSSLIANSQELYDENQIAYGNPDAKVTLVEFGDFQCPACGTAHQILKPVKDHYSNYVKFIYIHLPLTTIHPRAIPSAIALEAAGRQNKYWEYYNVLYSNQKKLGDEDLQKYAQVIGLDLEKFNTDLRDSSLREKVNRDYRKSVDLGINATPTFLLNEEKLRINSFYDIEERIYEAIVDAYPNEKIERIDLRAVNLNDSVEIEFTSNQQFSKKFADAEVGQYITFKNSSGDEIEIRQTSEILSDILGTIKLQPSETFSLVVYDNLSTVFVSNRSQEGFVLNVSKPIVKQVVGDLQDNSLNNKILNDTKEE